MAVRYLLDSDICIFLMKGRSPRLARRVDRLSASCGISLIAYGELCFGREASARREDVTAHLDALTEAIRVLVLPIGAAEQYARVRAGLERGGRLIGSNDMWIAAHALAENAALITNNEREFRRVPGLRVENWTR